MSGVPIIVYSKSHIVYMPCKCKFAYVCGYSAMAELIYIMAAPFMLKVTRCSNKSKGELPLVCRL